MLDLFLLKEPFLYSFQHYRYVFHPIRVLYQTTITLELDKSSNIPPPPSSSTLIRSLTQSTYKIL